HYGLQRNSGDTERNDREIVRVDHRVDIVACLVDFAMNVTFTVQSRSIGRNGLAVEPDLDDVGARDERRGHCARHEEAIGTFRGARADVSETVQYPLVCENAACCDDVLDASLVWITHRATLPETRCGVHCCCDQ